MAIFLDSSHRATHPILFDWMFRSRAAVFGHRCGWDVEVIDGREIDRYDRDCDPLYIVVDDGRGRPVGSLRLLPTTGDTMLGDEFASMFDEPVHVRSPLIWECTRFCVVPPGVGETAEAARRASSDLLIALCGHGLQNGIEQIQGLYDARMPRIYRRIGWSPSELARSKPEVGDLRVGLWDVTPEALDGMRRLAARKVGERDRAA